MLEEARDAPPARMRDIGSHRTAPRIGFTDRYLASLKPAAKRYDVIDAARKGLMLRVASRGTKTFFLPLPALRPSRSAHDRPLPGDHAATGL